MVPVPSYDWTTDPRVPALLAQLRDNPPKTIWYDIPCRASLRQTERVSEYEGDVAVALKSIRDEYGHRCLKYADADWDRSKHVATAWLNSKTVDQLIDDALAADRIAA